MFWNREEEENSLARLLKTQNFTLEDVLSNEFVVQECRYGNATLIAFLTRRENMVAMLNLSLNPNVEDSVPMRQQYRLSFISSEILTSRGTDVYQKAIVTDEETRDVLVSFLNDQTPINHLVAGFFAKIIECLLSKTFEPTFQILKNSQFFNKCLQNVSLGAMECLLENIVRIPASIADMDVVKQWMIEDHLFDTIIDRINNNSTDDDNESFSEVYCEIIRELRDKLYILENKEDALHDEIMVAERISKIADKVLLNEGATHEELTKSSSTIKACAKILETFIRTNLVINCPSHQIDDEERQELDERHNIYGGQRMQDNLMDHGEQIYQPDAERVVEGIVANRSVNIFQTILKDIKINGIVWQQLLRMFIEVANTNYVPTHKKLLAAFQKLPFIQLIEAAKSLPNASVLHALIVKLIGYVLYTSFPHDNSLSPVAEFLLKDSGLISSIYENAFNFHPSSDLISECGLRSFNMNMAQIILKASTSSGNASRITQILKSNNKWNELREVIFEYNMQHRPLNVGGSDDSNNESQNTSSRFDDSDFLNNSEEWTDGAAKMEELERSMNRMNAKSAPPSANEQFNFDLGRFNELEGEMFDTPDEDEFKKMCSQRAHSLSSTSLDDTSATTPQLGTSTDAVEWPGISTNTLTNSSNNGEEQTSENWVWPTTAPIGETEVITQAGPRPSNTWFQGPAAEFADICQPIVFNQLAAEENSVAETPAFSNDSNDDWADFSSFSRRPVPIDGEGPSDSWPGAEQQLHVTTDDSNSGNSNDSRGATDPVTVGLASGISHRIEEGSSDA